jgi:hypothetical protein
MLFILWIRVAAVDDIVEYRGFGWILQGIPVLPYSALVGMPRKYFVRTLDSANNLRNTFALSGFSGKGCSCIDFGV